MAPLTPPVQLALSSLVETGGTTLRSLLQRQAQWGEWDFFSYAPSIGEDIMWISLLARVRAAAEAPPELDALDGLRILAEVHGKGTEQTVATRILPDVLALKELLGGRCEVKIVSMVRHPVDLYLSWHQHWVSGLVPLCMWQPLPNIQARMVVGSDHFWRAGGDLSKEHGVQAFHGKGSEYMQRLALGVLSMYDFVGVMEHFDESVLLLADEVGLQHLGYVATNVRHGAGSLTKNDARSYVAPDKDVDDAQREVLQLARAVNLQSASARNVMGQQSRLLRDMENGKTTRAVLEAQRHAACNQHGCLPELRLRAGNYTADMCTAPHEIVKIKKGEPEGAHGLLPDAPHDEARTSEAEAVIARIKSSIELDEMLYAAAKRVFDRRVAAEGDDLGVRVAALREQSMSMAAAMDTQMEEPGVTCKHTSLNCVGADRYCVGCRSSDGEWNTVYGCWPDHPWKYRPAARQYNCTRTWSYGVTIQDSKTHFIQGMKNSADPTPCWRTCWERVPGMPGGAVGEGTCMSQCPVQPTLLKDTVTWVQERREKHQGWQDYAALHAKDKGFTLRRALNQDTSML